jgi:hypothetical protein
MDLSNAINEEKESDTFKALVLEKVNQFEKDLEKFIEYSDFISPTIDDDDRDNFSVSMTLHNINFYLTYNKNKDEFEITSHMNYQNFKIGNDGTYDKVTVEQVIENNTCKELGLQYDYDKSNFIRTKLYALLSTLESFNKDNPIDLEKLLAFARQKIDVKAIALAKSAWEIESA